MFDSLLIANRGEIACRIARSAKRMGIKTIAIYSSADANALHVKSCDEAYYIGSAPASESYLNYPLILELAQQAGAQAIHPGYGFLSENAEFARACQTAGIVFVGPPIAAIVAMGSKSEAKRLMSAAGVPLVPGYHGDEQSLELLREQSQRIGYPQLIKASAGGGGKGMRVVENFAAFDAALASAQREAAASFGDDKVLIERYLLKPRHIEMQVFADTQGQVIHLFERDCSVQRRHQKVIEEAPAPGMTADLRERMGKAATDAARAIAYVGAGTVEFLLDQSGEFFFMEMNTRLQVEHPVTEMISGQDLVEWQLRVAAGEPLPLKQTDLQIKGHAFEARVYAETPERGFLPSTGTLTYLQAPAASQHVRVDTGVLQGDTVSQYYDPMIAKLIVWDESRQQALSRLRTALNQYRIVGVNTNLNFLSTLTQLDNFANGSFDTGFIDQYQDDLFPPTADLPAEILALACLHQLLTIRQQTQLAQQATLDPWSPWGIADGWQSGMERVHLMEWQIGEQDYHVTAHFQEDGFLLDLPSGQYQVTGALQAEQQLYASVNGKRLTLSAVQQGQDLHLLYAGQNWKLHLLDPHAGLEANEVSAGNLTAQMPGTIVSLLVSEGVTVKAGDALMVMLAMKMENTITAPTDGTVTAIYFAEGDQVQDGDVLLSLE